MQDGRPRATVAMATYNGERWIELQLRSILAQLGPDDEIVIVDDASQDATLARIAAVTDGRMRVIAQPTNQGVRASFERALTEARGNAIFLADQDDLWLPGKVEVLLHEIERGALLALSDAQVIDGDGHATAASFMHTRGGFRAGLIATLAKNRYLGCAMAFRRELLARVLPIPPRVPMHDMWIGAIAACSGRVAYVDRPLMQYRRHGGNVSPGSRAHWWTMLRWRWALLSCVAIRVLTTSALATHCAIPGRAE